jgi:hypothetical protein
VPAYRIYRLSRDGHIQAPPRIIDCQDDKAAMQQARQLLDGELLEVWNENRKIGTVDPDEKAQP